METDLRTGPEQDGSGSIRCGCFVEKDLENDLKNDEENDLQNPSGTRRSSGWSLVADLLVVKEWPHSAFIQSKPSFLSFRSFSSANNQPSCCSSDRSGRNTRK